MKLIGSTTSPYVRRFRMLLVDHPIEFSALNIFAGEDREVLKAQNPTNRVPVLIDDGQAIVESRIIHRYLQQKLDLPPLSWAQENDLSLIDAATDSLIVLLLSKRSGIDIDSDLVVLNLQKDRMNSILPVLEQRVTEGAFSEWDYLAISLYTLIDWINFRSLWDLSAYPQLRQFIQDNAQQPMVAQSAPQD